MSRIRRGGYIFLTWKADHPPKHVHVYRDGRLVTKWNLEKHTVMNGKMTTTIERLLTELEQEKLL